MITNTKWLSKFVHQEDSTAVLSKAGRIARSHGGFYLPGPAGPWLWPFFGNLGR